MLLSKCVGDAIGVHQLSIKIQSHLDQQHLLEQHHTLAIALFGDDTTITKVLDVALNIFPRHLRVSSFQHLKQDIAQFSIHTPPAEETDEEEDDAATAATNTFNQSPLIILDNFTTADANAVSSLHQAWERERPYLRHEGQTYDLSSYVWLIAFRGETIFHDKKIKNEDVKEKNIQHGKNHWRDPLLAHLSTLSSTNQHSLTPEAAIGRLSGGFVLGAVSPQWVPTSKDYSICNDISSARGGGGRGGGDNAQVTLMPKMDQMSTTSAVVGIVTAVLLLMYFCFGSGVKPSPSSRSCLPSPPPRFSDSFPTISSTTSTTSSPKSPKSGGRKRRTPTPRNSGSSGRSTGNKSSVDSGQPRRSVRIRK